MFVSIGETSAVIVPNHQYGWRGNRDTLWHERRVVPALED